MLGHGRTTAHDRAEALPRFQPAVTLHQFQRPDDGRTGHPEGLHKLILTGYASAGRIRAILNALLNGLREAYVFRCLHFIRHERRRLSRLTKSTDQPDQRRIRRRRTN